MAGHENELVEYVSSHCPTARTIEDRTGWCAYCKTDLSGVPLAKRLLLLVGTVNVTAGAACDSCWGKVIDERPDDVNLTPFGQK